MDFEMFSHLLIEIGTMRQIALFFVQFYSTWYAIILLNISIWQKSLNHSVITR